MGCDLAAGVVEGISMFCFQGLGDPAMQQPPPCRAERGVGHRAQLLVAEVIGIVAVLAHNAPPP